MSLNEDEEEEYGISMFDEPQGYFKPEPPCTYQSFALNDGRIIELRLVGHNSLWGHHLWNGARALSLHLQKPAQTDRLVTNRSILELGAGAGLPSLVCAAIGADQIVVTDYPDADLVENLRWNVEKFTQLLQSGTERPMGRLAAEGYLWGADASKLVERVPQRVGVAPGFDTLILADLLFNHSEHAKLVRTVRMTLKRSKDARALVWFTPYRPWLLERDMKFFELVNETNGIGKEDRVAEDGMKELGQEKVGKLEIRKVTEELMEKVMFEEDPGDETLRRTVFGFELLWTDLQDESA